MVCQPTRSEGTHTSHVHKWAHFFPFACKVASLIVLLPIVSSLPCVCAPASRLMADESELRLQSASAGEQEDVRPLCT